MAGQPRLHFRHHPHFQSIHHGDPSALRKALKRLLFQPTMDASWESVSVDELQEIPVNNKHQRAKNYQDRQRCSKTIPMRDLLQHLRKLQKKIRAASGPEKIRGLDQNQSQSRTLIIRRVIIESNSDHSSKSNLIPRVDSDHRVIIESNHSQGLSRGIGSKSESESDSDHPASDHRVKLRSLLRVQS